VRAALRVVKNKQESTVRKFIFAAVGITLLVNSASQVAFSKEQRRHVRNAQQFSVERFRNTKAYAVPLYVPDAGSYSGLAGAAAAMTGFN
jgi:hypothetical protein